MRLCSYSWKAPWIGPPDADPVDVAYYRKHRPPQRCVLDAGHDGDHRSAFKVTARNDSTSPVIVVGDDQ